METGSIKKRKWTGRWIEPQQEPALKVPDLTFEQMVAAESGDAHSEAHLKCAKHLRRSVSLQNDQGDLPIQAVLYASAHGVYDLYLNGCKADQRVLAPETTNYKKIIWYQKYDVTDLIDNSDIAYMDVLLGDGWWTGHLGMSGANCNYGDKLAFIMDLELTYPDGSVQTIGSDESFLSCDSFIRYADLFIGEMQDGRAHDFMRAPSGNNACAASVWTPCIAASYPTDILVLQPIPGITAVETIPVKTFIDTPKQELVADFGQVLAGVVQITVDAPANAEIVLEHAEALDKEGNYFNNIKGVFKDQRDRYVCRGGIQTFIPHFTYHGFRYVRITGIEKEDILDLKAVVWATPLKKLGFFETDNEKINALEHAIESSTRSNMISIPTDCPQREKLGWTGDISIFTKTGAFLYDLRNFLKSWLLQVRLDQFPDGEIPVVVPNHPCQDNMQRGMSGGTNSSAAWSDCIIFMPLQLYRIYGDISFLADNFDAMEKWLAYVQNQAPEGLWNKRFHFGDWLIPSLREKENGVMLGVAATSDIAGSCYYSLAVSAMVEICLILGKEKQAETYTSLLADINKALVQAYVYEDGRVGVHAADPGGQDPDMQLMGLYVLLLKTGAVKDAGLKDKMLARLAAMIREQEYTLDCGFSSIGFLLDVLYDNGYPDVAYKLLFSSKAPSWLYMVEHGATTIWENWRAVREDGTVTDSSFNHYAYGCVGDFMYRHIGGIEVLEPGYSKVKIAPDFNCGIKKSSCIRRLPDCTDLSGADVRREIMCSWELDEQNPSAGHIHIEIPEGVCACAVLPSGTFEIQEGTYDYSITLEC